MGAYQSITKWLKHVVYSLVCILVGWIASHLNWLLVQHHFSDGLRLSIPASGSFSVSKVALICCSWFPALRKSSKKPENSPSGLRWHLLWAVQLISCFMHLSFSFGSQEAISGDREKQWSIYLMDLHPSGYEWEQQLEVFSEFIFFFGLVAFTAIVVQTALY